jgi:hypothetical protein
LLAIASLLGLTPVISRAADKSKITPADELLRYVPGDVAFCFVARDLRASGEALAASPFVASLRKTPAGEAIAHADELNRLSKLQEGLQKQLGIDWEKLRTDVLGEAIVFAYRPGPPGKPEDEEGLILIRAAHAKSLTELVDHINEAQKASGEVKDVEKRTHHGVTYFCRQERDKPPTYYILRGPVLMLSGNETMLQTAFDQDSSMPSEAESAISRELRLSGAERTRSAAPEAATMKVFERYWSALDSVVFSLALDKDLTFSVALRGRPDQLPVAAKRLVSEFARTSDLWRAFPDRTMVAAAGRVDIAALVQAVIDFLPSDGRTAVAGELNRSIGPALGKDFVKEVLPCLGPDAGFCLYAPPVGDRAYSPHGFAALKVAPGDPDAPVDQAVFAGVHTIAILAVLAHNAKNPDHPLSLKSVTHDKHEVKYLAGDGAFPPGLQPAFGLNGGYLVVATSPEIVRRFAPAPSPTPAVGEGVPLLRLNFKEVREYLKGNRETLTETVAERDGLKPDVVRGRLQAVIDTLELLDRLEISQRSSAGQTAITFRLQTAQPLKN